MHRRCAPVFLFLLGLLVSAPPSWAQANLGPITVGAGLRTSFVDTMPDASNLPTNQFLLNDVRLYVSGPVYQDVKFMFNTDYNSTTNSVNGVGRCGAIRRVPEFNIWAGRFLPPSDRANLYGPFYAHEWAVYTDGIQDGYPFVYQGRDNGVMYYGTFAKKVKVSLGAFDGKSATGNAKVLFGAARVQIDFWDPEDGYYLNGTYYGDKNLLAIGGARPVSRWPHCIDHRFPPRKESAPWRRIYHRERVFELQPAGRLQRGLCQESRRLWARKFPLSKSGRSG